MPLAPKGSKSEKNKRANAANSVWNPAIDPIDRYSRAALSRGAVHNGGLIRLDGSITSLATVKTQNKSAETAARRARRS
jgi:hypothetical protein